MERVYKMKIGGVVFVGLVTMLSFVTVSAFPEISFESEKQNTQSSGLYTQCSYTLSEATPILAVIPENIAGGISLLNFVRLSSSLPSFNFKSEKTALFSFFREKLLEKKYINAPVQDGKGEVFAFIHSKSYFVYKLREIIV